ncbi:MAG: hypothetical protein H7320_03105 [Ferruginibacter sp.]|nr:hypothetical protein [Ferruginibacter sp.]
MVKRLSYKTCLQHYPALPHEQKGKFVFPKNAGENVLSLTAISLSRHIQILTGQLKNLFKTFGITHLVFCQEVKCPWLMQQNDFYKVKKARAYFTSIGVSDRFDGGLVVPTEEFNTFLPNLFWIIRCNADMPLINFADDQQQLTARLCKHGNLHIYGLKDTIQERLTDWLITSKLHNIEWHQCSNQYYNTSAIKGRRINL